MLLKPLNYTPLLRHVNLRKTRRIMTSYLPSLNGIYDMNMNMNYDFMNQYFADIVNQQINNKNKVEAKEIIHCLNDNFEKLLGLNTGSIELYGKEIVKNNNNMVNIDDNMDQIFLSLKHLLHKLEDIEVKQIEFRDNMEKKVMDKLNKLSLELKNNCKPSLNTLLHSLDSKIELLNINIEEVALSNSVAIQRLNLKSYETHTNVLDLKNKLKDMNKQLSEASSLLKACDFKQESDSLQFDYDVLNFSFTGVNVENKIKLVIAPNIIDIKYITKKNAPEYDKGGGQSLPFKSLSQCFNNNSHFKTDIDENASFHFSDCSVKNNNKKKRKRKKKKGKDIQLEPPDPKKPPDLLAKVGPNFSTKKNFFFSSV